MNEAIVAALITGVVTLLGTIITSVAGSKLTAYKLEELRADFADLRRRVERHNSLVERVAIVEQSVKSAHHRLDALTPPHSPLPPRRGRRQ